MGKGGYNGGSTIVYAGSDWFGYTSKDPKPKLKPKTKAKNQKILRRAKGLPINDSGVDRHKAGNSERQPTIMLGETRSIEGAASLKVGNADGEKPGPREPVAEGKRRADERLRPGEYMFNVAAEREKAKRRRIAEEFAAIGARNQKLAIAPAEAMVPKNSGMVDIFVRKKIKRVEVVIVRRQNGATIPAGKFRKVSEGHE